jgi:hypothetical protein
MSCVDGCIVAIDSFLLLLLLMVLMTASVGLSSCVDRRLRLLALLECCRPLLDLVSSCLIDDLNVRGVDRLLRHSCFPVFLLY